MTKLLRMKESAEIFNQVVNERRSVRMYDDKVPFDTEAVARSIDRAILAPNSSNMQLWEFYRVRDLKKISAIAAFCFNQPAARTATELIIVVTRLDKWKAHAHSNLESLKKQFKEPYEKKEQSALDYYGKVMPLLYSHDRFNFIGFFKQIVAAAKGLTGLTYWQVGYSDLRTIVHKSAALASQTIMLSMKAEGFDTCPMEGFDSRKVKNYLGLPSGAEINMIISTGTAKAEGIYGDRIRLDRSEVVFEV